jgi:hypothetical protein
MAETHVSRWILVIVLATCGVVFWLPALVRGNTATHMDHPDRAPTKWTMPAEEPQGSHKEPLSTGLAGVLCALAMGTTSLVVYILCRPAGGARTTDRIIAAVRPSH